MPSTPREVILAEVGRVFDLALLLIIGRYSLESVDTLRCSLILGFLLTLGNVVDILA